MTEPDKTRPRLPVCLPETERWGALGHDDKRTLCDGSCFSSGEGKYITTAPLLFGCDFAPHLEISLACCPAVWPECSLDAKNQIGSHEVFQVRETEADDFYGVRARDYLPPHPCSPYFCRREGRREEEREENPIPYLLQERQADPASLAWLAGTLGTWRQSGVGEVAPGISATSAEA